MSAATNDRAVGAVLGMAAGDALGAPYEFKPPFPDDFVPAFTGGGAFGWEPGEWTDDTSMAVPILHALAAGERLEDEVTLDGIVAAWIDWAATAPDVGSQTRAVLARTPSPTAAAAREAAREIHEGHGRSAGNGSLMRTAPVGLAYLGAHDEPALAAAARAVSDLTHFEADAGDACVLWSLAIRHAILTGELDVRRGIAFLPTDRRSVWSDRLDVAERSRPRNFTKNGWVVEALQGAWSAITHIEVPSELPARHLQLALEEAVRGGRDADTVAAIAGGMLGARWGSSAIPSQWKRKLHGWPGLRTRDLTHLAFFAANVGRTDRQGWPTTERMHSPYATFVQHPHDEGVWLGGLAALDDLPAGIDAVVSLCRTGTGQTDREQVEMWLVNQPGSRATRTSNSCSSTRRTPSRRCAQRECGCSCTAIRVRAAPRASARSTPHGTSASRSSERLAR